MVNIEIKWKKNVYKVTIDVEDGIDVFKAQMFALTHVPVEKQLYVYKRKKLSNDDDLLKIKDGSKIKMTGTMIKVIGPTVETIFKEDLPESEQQKLGDTLPSGLKNLGNTCYLNSNLQCFNNIPDLKKELVQYTEKKVDDSEIYNQNHQITYHLGNLLKELSSSVLPVIPYKFVETLRSVFKEFDQRDPNTGGYMQHDSSEVVTKIFTCLKKQLGSKKFNDLFGIEMSEKLTCTENEEEINPIKMTNDFMLRCVIGFETKYLVPGLVESLKSEVLKKSPSLKRQSLYKIQQRIENTPKYLIVQLTRFFWKKLEKGGVNAKIIRKVEIDMKLDLQPLCGDKLGKAILKKRELFAASRLKQLGVNLQEDNKKKEENKMQVEEEISQKDLDAVKTLGYYDLIGVVSHRGRSADSGHYVSWGRPENKGGKWILYDDAKTSETTVDKVKHLSGGYSDSQIGFILYYQLRDEDFENSILAAEVAKNDKKMNK